MKGEYRSLLSSLGPATPNPDFTIFVKTDNSGTSASDQFTIPTTGGGYNYDVDWGDSTTSTGVTGSITHTFPSPGIYMIKISGSFPRIYFNNGGDKDKLLRIHNWGNIVWSTMERSFNGCENLDITATDLPDLSTATSTDRMLNAFPSSLIGNSSFGNWDVSNINNMIAMFSFCESFNQDLSSWDVSNVTNMYLMFNHCGSFNQDISGWDVSSVTDMSYMFNILFGSSAFNQNLSTWDISSLITAKGMFANSVMSTANYTDTIVGWANYVFVNGGALNVDMSNQSAMTFDTLRSGGANFANAGAARIYLTTATPIGAGWTISGDTVI